MRQSPHPQRLSSRHDGALPARGAAYRLAPRDGSMPLRRHDGQGMSVPSRLPHNRPRSRALSPQILRGTWRLARRAQRAAQRGFILHRLQTCWWVQPRRGHTMETISDRGDGPWHRKAEGFFWCTSISTLSTTRNLTSGITRNAQFIAVCRRAKMVAMGTRRPRRGPRLCRRWALKMERRWLASRPVFTRYKV